MARLHLRSEILPEGTSITPTSRQQRQSKEAVAKRFSVEKMFLEILQNWQENTCASASFLIKLQGFSDRTPLVAASVSIYLASFL